MKKVIVGLVSAAALATVGMAAAANSMAASDQSQSFPAPSASGIYVDGLAGYGMFNVKRPAGATGFSNTGFTWSADLGYQIIKYLAVEAGYTQFANAKASDAIASDTIKDIYGIDLLAKAIAPINSQWNIFAKAGAMYLSAKTADSVNGISVGPSATTTRYVPEYAIGTSYFVTKNVDVSLEGVGTMAVKGSGTGSNSVTMPQTYAGYAGLGYKFNM